MDSIFQFSGVSLLVIVAIAAAVQRQRRIAEKELLRREAAERKETGVYEIAEELSVIREQLEAGHIHAAIPTFVRCMIALAGFSQKSFTSLEWKDFYTQTATELECLKAFILENDRLALEQFIQEHNERMAIEKEIQRKRHFWSSVLPAIILSGIAIIFTLALILGIVWR